jgi:diaminohydroxyphosphoribosylaminopyrimidine deaminase/5-amino-6-(5-phosphoribosylamino)uracil reductase
MAFTDFDTRMMRRALQLARRGAGSTSPNPMVGAVVARSGRVIGEGYHRKAGEPHAEVLAIRNAQRSTPNVRRATLYVTLEPCSTFGRTPPCTEAIIAAGIKRVVVAAIDPNPKHAGRGIKILRRAGVRVETGLLADEAARLNEAFNKWVTTGLPFVTAKAAMSLDGKIATRTGDSKWITSEAARKVAHQLRAHADAVMVGSRTVIRDNPSLTVRLARARKQPKRIVVDSRGRSPLTSRVFTDAWRANTIALTTSASKKSWRDALTKRDVVVLVLPRRKGHVDLRAALKELARRDITSLLVEGGGELLGALFDARLVDKVAFFFAPKIIGGRVAPTSVAGEGIGRVASALMLREVELKQVGPDYVVTGYL